MYDLYYEGNFIQHMSERSFDLCMKAITDMCKGSHWVELFNVPVSRVFVFRGDVDGKITFRFVKD